MTGEDHYYEAERLSRPRTPPGPFDVTKPRQFGSPRPEDISFDAPDYPRAQVHATLAVADRLTRIAALLEKLVQAQREDDESR